MATETHPEHGIRQAAFWWRNTDCYLAGYLSVDESGLKLSACKEFSQSIAETAAVFLAGGVGALLCVVLAVALSKTSVTSGEIAGPAFGGATLGSILGLALKQIFHDLRRRRAKQWVAAGMLEEQRGSGASGNTIEVTPDELKTAKLASTFDILAVRMATGTVTVAAPHGFDEFVRLCLPSPQPPPVEKNYIFGPGRRDAFPIIWLGLFSPIGFLIGLAVVIFSKGRRRRGGVLVAWSVFMWLTYFGIAYLCGGFDKK